MSENTPSLSSSLSGIWVPLVTPLIEGQIDHDSLNHLVQHYTAQGAAGFIPGATTGEGTLLRLDEVHQVVDTVLNANQGRLPVWIGAAENSVRDMLPFLDATADWGIDGYLVSAPHVIKPPQEGLYRYFETVAEAASRPVIVYNNPGRTGANISNDTMLRLAALPTIVGVKDCCGRPTQSLELLQQRPEGFAVLVGDDDQILIGFSNGADGAISTSAHVLLPQYREMMDLLRCGAMEVATQIHHRVAPLIPLLFAEGNPAGVKSCLLQMELIRSSEIKEPLLPVTPALEGLLGRFLRQESLIS